MRYIVIGSKGFVGSSILKSLTLETKEEVIGISKQEIDLLSIKSTEKIKTKINEDDVIVFCAAEAPVKNLNMFTNNINMLSNLLYNLENINIKNFVYLSSDAVYSDSMKSINEEYETKPDNLHGIMHLTRENIVKNLFSEKHLIVRPTLIYGFGDPHLGYGPNQFINTAINMRKIELFGKGEEQRDHISINELTVLFSQLIVNNQKGVFNLVSGDVISFSEIADLIVNLAFQNNLEVDINYKKRIGHMPHNGFRKLENEKILNLFPNKDLFNFKKNIKEYFEKSLLKKNNKIK